MGNNKSLLLNFQQQQKQAECPSSLVESKMGTVNSTSSLPLGLNVNAFSSSPASTAGFLKRIRHHANHNKSKSRKKMSSLERLNESHLSIKECDRGKNNKKKKFLVFTDKKTATTTTTTKITNDNDQITAQLIICSKPTTNDIVIEPEYTSISDCHSTQPNNNMAIDAKSNVKFGQLVEESFYESALEVYELTVASEKKIKYKNLDFNLYSEVASKTNETATPHSILVISNALHFKKYYLNNFFNRIKNTKKIINRNKRTAQSPPEPPQLPSKAFNPAKEFIYEQTKYANSNKDNESNIYFKIGKNLAEEEDELLDETDCSTKKQSQSPSPPPVPPLPKQVKTKESIQTIAQCDALKLSNLIMSCSASSESSTSSASSSSQFERSFSFEEKPLQAPPLPPLPDKSTLPYSPIQSFNLNNQVYYSFIGNPSTR